MKIIRQQNFIWWLQETLKEINIATLLKAILQELKYLCIGNNMNPSFFRSITYGQWYRTHPAFNMPTKNAAHLLSNRFNEHYWKHKYTLFWYTINSYPTHNFTCEVLTTKYYDHHQLHPWHDVAERIHSQNYGYLPTKWNRESHLIMLKTSRALLKFS